MLLMQTWTVLTRRHSHQLNNKGNIGNERESQEYHGIYSKGT